MNIKLIVTFILASFTTLIVSTNASADYVIDDFQNTAITAPPNIATVTAQSFSSDIAINRVASGSQGYTIAYSGSATGALGTARIEYSFTNGLRSIFGSGAASWAPVKFYIPLFLGGTGAEENGWDVKVTYSGSSVETDLTPGNSILEIDTLKTIADLDSNDITAVRFDFSFSDSTYLGGTDQTIVLGGNGASGGVGSFTAIPEPVSAMTFGVLLLGGLFRRKRRA